ncbi:MAG: ribonuclease HI [Candidatus Cloacimonetes bacterium]|nr:ribonuclease HI [Candidatus Cloacimonadota bacterium]
MKLKKVKIFCDGSCKYNPGPGGWAAILKYKNHHETISGFAEHTTNNIMELTAAIKALKKIKEKCEIEIFSDSKYVVFGITDWIKNWKIMGWKRKKNKTIKNVELWKKLDDLCSQHNVKWIWVKGHNGHPENEKCDAFAKKEIEKNI